MAGEPVAAKGGTHRKFSHPASRPEFAFPPAQDEALGMASFDFDAVVIGGGSAGYAAARTLVDGGAKTAVIDGASQLGGLCILRGCMPTKALLHAAELRHHILQASIWGIRAQSVTVSQTEVLARKDALIEEFAGYRRGQLEDGRFELIRSQARFLNAHTLELGPGRSLSAAHMVIATGSQISRPPIPGLMGTGILTSDDALQLREIPASMAVLGGGAVALEFAQYFSRFGCRVTLIQRSPHVLREADPDVARELETALRLEGIAIHTGTQLLDVEPLGTGGGGPFQITFDQEDAHHALKVDAVFNGLGREPNTEGLHLNNSGIALDGTRIVTNRHQATTVPHLYAAGDCCGPHEIVHLAIQQGEVAARNILKAGSPREMDYRLLTTVVFTDPAVAQVGMTESEAHTQGIPYRVATHPFNDHGKSMILGCKAGFVKLIANSRTGELLGGACVGPQGGELIHEITVALAARMTAAQFAAIPHYHPTLAEIWTYPAEALAEAVRDQGDAQ